LGKGDISALDYQTTPTRVIVGMDKILAAALLAAALVFGVVLFMEVGRAIGVRCRSTDPKGVRAGIGAIEGAAFALLGLLIAFTFSGAASRFDERRAMIIDETNAIGTAYLRLGLLPSELHPVMRERFRQYLDVRLNVYRRLPDLDAAMAELAKANTIQKEIWTQAIAAAGVKGAKPDAMKLLLPALNDMFDIAQARFLSTEMHPPLIIYIMLSVLALVSAMMAGYSMAAAKSRQWLHLIGFALMISITVYIIIDLEYPRLGLIRVDAFDRALVELREGMN
jgi:hypothetical protein